MNKHTFWSKSDICEVPMTQSSLCGKPRQDPSHKEVPVTTEYTGKTIDITPVIAVNTYSPHTQVLKRNIEALSRLCGEDTTDTVIASHVRGHLAELREAAKQLLADDFILMMQQQRRSGQSYCDTLNSKPVKR